MTSKYVAWVRFYAKSAFAWIKAWCYSIISRTDRNRSYQRKELSSLLSYVRKYVPYYTTLIQNSINQQNCLDVLSRLPLLTKQQIREAGDAIFSKEITTFGSENWQYWHNTGGSTGNPLKFPLMYSSKVELELTHQAWIYQKMGVKMFDRISSVDGRRVPNEQLREGIYWGENSYNFPYGQFHYSTMYLNEQTAPYYLAHLNRYPPKVLRGYPSGIMTLCRYMESSGLNIKFKLKGVYITSENSSEDDCRYISKILKCPVWGQYGHSEMSVFGIRHPDSEAYYCSPFYGITEILDEQGHCVPPGSIGEIVVTGFQNRALPFIRYKTGDLARYGGALDDGTVVLTKLEGRNTDYIINMNNEKIYLVGYIFGGHLDAFNHISQWQIEQNEMGKLVLRIVKADSFTDKVERELISFFSNKLFSVVINYCSEIPKTNRGKQKFLIQNLS